MNTSPAPKADAAPAAPPAREAAHREPSKAPFVALAMLGGVFVAVQGRVNGTLAGYLDDAFLTAVISFGGSLLVISCAYVASRRAREAYRRVLKAAFGTPASLVSDGGTGLAARAPAKPRRRLRWYHLLGGLGGAFFTLSQGLTIGSLGVAIFIVALVAGQSSGSLFVDKFGLAPSGPLPVTFGRAIGPILAITATVISVVGYFDDASGLWLAVIPFVAGAGQSVQQAINGHVRGAAAAPPAPGGKVEQAPGIIAATFQNFALGFPVLLAAYGIELLVRGPIHDAFPSNPLWYLGGPLAVGFISIAAAVVHRIGALLLALGMITGQTLGALVIDVLTGYQPSTTTYIATALTLAAVSIPAITTARAAKHASPAAAPALAAASPRQTASVGGR